MPPRQVDLNDPLSRVRALKGNLLRASLYSVLGNAAQSKKYAIPGIQDTYLDAMITETPQHVKDYQNAQIDATTRGTVQSVLATNPLNRAANTIAVANANALGAKGRLAVEQAERDIQRKNTYLGAKQRTLDRYNAMVAEKQNQETQNANNQAANYGAIGTNLENELGRVKSNEYAIYDRNQVLKSQGQNLITALQSFREQQQQASGGVNGGGAINGPVGGELPGITLPGMGTPIQTNSIFPSLSLNGPSAIVHPSLRKKKGPLGQPMPLIAPY